MPKSISNPQRAVPADAQRNFEQEGKGHKIVVGSAGKRWQTTLASNSSCGEW